MPEYRAYIVGEDGQFVGYEPIVCANDNEATEKARHLSNRGPVELWSGPIWSFSWRRQRPATMPSHMHDGRMDPMPSASK